MVSRFLGQRYHNVSDYLGLFLHCNLEIQTRYIKRFTQIKYTLCFPLIFRETSKAPNTPTSIQSKSLQQLFAHNFAK